MEVWWADAHDNPAAYRDPVSVASLVDGALQADPSTRDAAAGALSGVVKALDDDPIEESVRIVARRMPELVRGLADPDPSYSGQMISIARRIPIDAATVEALLALIDTTPAAEDRVLPVSALGICADDVWSDRIESTLASCLGDPVTFGAAVDGFYGREHRFRRPETVRAIGSGVIQARHLDTTRAIATLWSLLRSDFAALATAMLEQLAAARPELRAEIAEIRRWAAPD